MASPAVPESVAEFPGIPTISGDIFRKPFLSTQGNDTQHEKWENISAEASL